MNTDVWFKRPGHPSSLIPNEGIPQQCNTSAAVTITRMCVFVGKTTRLSTSNNLKAPGSKSSVWNHV